MKIDYTTEYKNLLSALTTNDDAIIKCAAEAMGLKYEAGYIDILFQLNKRFIVSGYSAESANCVLRDENE